MNNIITHIEFAELRNISNKYDNDKAEASIAQAHGDLREALGSAFFFDVMKNQDNADYADLLEGSEFIKDEMVYYHEGLKALVSDYTYGRYLYEINANPSPFGMVTKNSNDSQPVDRNMIKDLVGQANKDAVRKLQLIEDYLDVNKETFSIWAKQQESGIDTSDSSFSSTRFSFFSSGK